MLMNNLIKDPALQRKVTPPVMLAIDLGLFGALYPKAHDLAWGALAGSGAVTIAFLVALFVRRPVDNSFVRGATGKADERDLRILLAAGATTGFTAILCVAAGMVALVWGADPMLVLGIMAWVLVLSFIVAHVVMGRRL